MLSLDNWSKKCLSVKGKTGKEHNLWAGKMEHCVCCLVSFTRRGSEEISGWNRRYLYEERTDKAMIGKDKIRSGCF